MTKRQSKTRNSEGGDGCLVSVISFVVWLASVVGAILVAACLAWPTESSGKLIDTTPAAVAVMVVAAGLAVMPFEVASAIGDFGDLTDVQSELVESGCDLVIGFIGVAAATAIKYASVHFDYVSDAFSIQTGHNQSLARGLALIAGVGYIACAILFAMSSNKFVRLLGKIRQRQHKKCKHQDGLNAGQN